MNDRKYIRPTPFSHNLYYLRKRLGLSQSKLLRLFWLTTGERFSTASYLVWEKGKSVPRWSNIVKLAKFFNLDVDVMLYTELNGSLYVKYVYVPPLPQPAPETVKEVQQVEQHTWCAPSTLYHFRYPTEMLIKKHTI